MKPGEEAFLRQLKEMWETRKIYYLFSDSCDVDFAHRIKDMYIDTTYSSVGEKIVFSHVEKHILKKGELV